MNIKEIIGIEDKYIKLLEKEGISQVEDLLSLTAYKISQIAEKTGIPAKLIDTWQEHADLMRIEGVTPQYAYALNQIGIDSVKELANRNPKNTFEKIKEFAKQNAKILSKLPVLEVIELWIIHAKQIKDLEPTVKPKKKTTKRRRRRLW